MHSVLFTIEVSGEYQQRGDGINELYVAQAIAPNGEKLHYRGEAVTVYAALEQLARQVRRQADAFAHG